MDGPAMTDWRDNLLEDDDRIRDLLGSIRRIAVLGIKPESRAHKPAHFVPRYAMAVGYEIVPVPVYYPELREILGLPVYRRISDIPGTVDLVNVFRRPRDIPAHLPDLLQARPRAVWFQLGIRHGAAAKALAEAGVQVVQDRCLSAEHDRLVGTDDGV